MGGPNGKAISIANSPTFYSMFLAQSVSLLAYYIHGWAKWKGYINYISGMTNFWKFYLESIQKYF
jgi:hypothetical protein